MHKPTDEYFGRYETGFFSSSLFKLKCLKNETYTLKVLWTFKNIFGTLHDLIDSDEKTKML